MGYLFDALVAAVLATAGVADSEIQRVAEQAELVFGRADSEIALRTELFRSIFGDEHYDWAVDLEAGTIIFTSATKMVTAPVQVIGTYTSLDRTFLWGWDHPSIPEPRRADARTPGP